MKKSDKIQLFLLSLVPFIMVLGNSMLIPILPKIKKAVGLSQFQAGLMITAFSVPAGLTIPFAGIVSDQIGRKKVMVPALIVYGIGGLIAGFSALLMQRPSWGILVGRIIQGIGAGGTYQLAMALTGDKFTEDERGLALGLLETANGLGKVISPILGTLFATIVWFFPFFSYGILAIPIALTIWFYVKEKNDFSKQSMDTYANEIGEIFKDKASGLIACFFAGMTSLFCLFGNLSLYSDILEEKFSIFGFKKGLIMAGPVFIMASLSFLVGIFIDKNKNKGLKTFVITGVAFIILGQVLFAMTSGMWARFAFICLLGAGVGLVMTPVNTLVTGSCSTKRRGIITCLYGSLRFFGVAIGPPLYGLSEKYGVSIVLWLTLVPIVSLITAILFLNGEKILQKAE